MHINDLIKHILNVHEMNKETIQCNFCEYKAYNRNAVRDHVEAEHLNKLLLNHMTYQHNELTSAFKGFKEDLIEVLNKIVEDHNIIKQELFIIRQSTHSSKSLDSIENKIEAISSMVQSTGLIKTSPQNRQEPVAPRRVVTNNVVTSTPTHIPRVCIVSDSIGGNVDLKTLERAMDSRIDTVKAFSSSDDLVENEAKHATKQPENTLQNALRNKVKNNQIETLIIQTGSVDITNLKTGASNVERFSNYFRDHTVKAANKVMDEVTKTLSQNPYIKKAIVMKQIPRFDRKEVDPCSVKAALVNVYNDTLVQRWMDSPLKERLSLGSHCLEVTSGSFESRYRNRQKNWFDGVHLYGPSGRKSYTESVLMILRQADLIKVTPPSYFRKYHQNTSVYSVPTANKYQALSHVQGN